MAQTEPENSARKDVVSYAGPMKALDLQELVDRSELVVVAEVTRLLDSPGEYIREQSVNQAKLYAAEVTVREVLKGNLQPGKIVVGGLLPIRSVDRKNNGPLKPDMVRIFFLVREQNSWRFADPFFGVLIAAPVTPRPTVAAISDKVMEQLFAALRSNLVSTDEKRILISYFRASSDSRIVPALKAELEKPQDEALTNALLAELISRNDDKKWDDMLQHWRQFRDSREAKAGH